MMAADTKSDPSLVTACLFLFFLVIGGAVCFLDFSFTAGLAGLICLVAIAPTLGDQARERLDVMEIIHPMLFLYLLYFGARSFYFLHFGIDDPSRPDFTGTMNLGLIYTLIGLIFLLTGYYSGLGEKLSDRLNLHPGGLPKARGYMAVIGLFALGGVCRLYVYSTGYYTRFLAGQREAPEGYLMAIDYVGFASYYAFILGVALACQPKASRWFKLFVWTTLVPANLFMALLGGAKMEVIWLLIGVLLACHYFVKPIPVKTLLVGVPLIILILFPLVNTYRGISGMNLELTPLQVLPLISDELTQYASEDFIEKVFGEFMGRLPGIDALSLVIQFTPEVLPFQYGATMIIAPLIAFVPSFLWPGKYDFINSVANGVEFGEVYFGIRGNTSGVAITQLGELYMNFGGLGIPVGMFLIGVISRSAYHWFILHGKTPLGLMVYLFIYVHLIFIEGWFGSTYSNLMKHLALTTLIVYFLKTEPQAAQSTEMQGEGGLKSWPNAVPRLK